MINYTVINVINYKNSFKKIFGVVFSAIGSLHLCCNLGIFSLLFTFYYFNYKYQGTYNKLYNIINLLIHNKLIILYIH